jgi:hypothetical protein
MMAAAGASVSNSTQHAGSLAFHPAAIDVRHTTAPPSPSYGHPMQRRVTVDLLATEIDSLDRLLRARDGVVFVYLDPRLHALELQLEDDRYDFRTQAKDRWLRGRLFTCAIFRWIPSGTYTLRYNPARLEAVVTVRAGELTQVDWRATFTGWRDRRQH